MGILKGHRVLKNILNRNRCCVEKIEATASMYPASMYPASVYRIVDTLVTPPAGG